MMKKLISLLFLFGALILDAQEKVIPLYQGPAPGSEKWDWHEKIFAVNNQTRMVYNVSSPTLTTFLPDPSAATGTAVIICPGGAFYILMIDHEGFDVARWLNKKGIAAFVLKYRLAQSMTDEPGKELQDKMQNDMPGFQQAVTPVIPMDLADGLAAIGYVRNHAKEFHVLSDHIGIIGFSAGGTVAAGAAYNYTSENRPNFAAPIYPYLGPVNKMPIPKDAPPIFIAVTSDDSYKFAPSCADLYKDWTAAGHAAELHIYPVGGHGFGMHKQHLPVDGWIDRFGEWLNQQGF